MNAKDFRKKYVMPWIFFGLGIVLGGFIQDKLYDQGNIFAFIFVLITLIMGIILIIKSHQEIKEANK